MIKPYNEYDFSDITPDPIPQDDSHLAQIAYTPEFSEAMALFRALQAQHEVSERAIAVTTAMIKMNPAHYSVWDYRFEVVNEIGNNVFDHKTCGLSPSSAEKPLIGEDGVWLNEFTLANPKNYQVWNYRQLVADYKNVLWYKGEKVIMDMVLEDDSKNFHTWSHFKHIVDLSLKHCPQAFDPLELLQYTEKMLKKDVLNNSVWSFRFFLMLRFPTLQRNEFDFIASQALVRPNNESVWSYLVGFARLVNSMEPAIKLAEIYPDQPRAVEALAEMSSDNKLYLKLAEMEPTRQPFWRSRACT